MMRRVWRFLAWLLRVCGPPSSYPAKPAADVLPADSVTAEAAAKGLSVAFAAAAPQGNEAFFFRFHQPAPRPLMCDLCGHAVATGETMDGMAGVCLGNQLYIACRRHLLPAWYPGQLQQQSQRLLVMTILALHRRKREAATS